MTTITGRANFNTAATAAPRKQVNFTLKTLTLLLVVNCCITFLYYVAEPWATYWKQCVQKLCCCFVCNYSNGEELLKKRVESAKRNKQWWHSHTFRLVSPSRLAVVMWQVPSARSDDSSTKSAGKVSSLATRTMSPTWVDRKESATIPEKTLHFKWGQSDLSCGSLKLEKGRVSSATL